MASNLETIRTKIRRITRSPSPDIISDADINEYINTAFLYDFPEIIRLSALRKVIKFFTIPNVDVYSTNTVNPTDPLYNFKNLIVTSHMPFYVAGFKCDFSQSREDFFNRWPNVNSQVQVGSGDGATLTFAGTIQQGPVIQNNVTFSSIGANNSSLVLKDVPVYDANGNPTSVGNLYVPNTEPATPPLVVDPNNNINYVTGAYRITFPAAPANAEAIWSLTIPYAASRPFSVLWFDYSFTLRPVPDISYPVTFEAYVRPTALLADQQEPDLQQWWQYLAYLAAKKILEDRTQYDIVQAIMPALKEQEALVLRTTLVQQGDTRSTTIYSDQSSLSGGPYQWWNNVF